MWMSYLDLNAKSVVRHCLSNVRVGVLPRTHSLVFAWAVALARR